MPKYFGIACWKNLYKWHNAFKLIGSMDGIKIMYNSKYRNLART